MGDETRRGIIFEGSFENSFMHLAVSEGLARPLDRTDEILPEVLADYARARKRTEALDLCLLYDKVLLYDYHDLFDMTRLLSEDLIEEIEPIDPATYLSQRGRKELDAYLEVQDAGFLRMMRPILLPYLHRREKRVNSQTYDLILSLASDKEFRECCFHDSWPLEMLAKIASISDMDKLLKTVPPRMIPKIAKELKRRMPVSKLREAILLDVASCVFVVLWAYDELIRFLDIIHHSASRFIPIATPFIPKSVWQTTKGSFPNIINAESHYRIYRIVVDEVEYFPRVDSLQDVIRLRQDRRIRDFRETINLWADRLHDGDVRVERRLRTEIRKANQELRQLPKWKKTAGIVTYLSLPLSFAGPLGTALTAISVGIQLYIDRIEFKNRWLMIGR